MAIKLDAKYHKLKEIALSAERFVWNASDDLYTGPINPVGIYIWTSSYHHVVRFVFVLAEHVPPQYLEEAWDETSPGGFIAAELNSKFEFADWDPTSKTIGKIGADSSPDGSLWGRCAALASNPAAQISMAILFFEHQGNGHTGLLMQKC